ncbi:hypothetical protein F5890DRAFT_1535295 [Lentinula detonsa]|uniref:Novel STAND NTPase 1 domain-containing protein n=1 Tax=Lentinula detonsa TaxID=2804962 RepID=A0AA38PTN4_9AGAR|nr:hypothetical protein F5890DRAFT_1535295 [Lentinula detonsa]
MDSESDQVESGCLCFWKGRKSGTSRRKKETSRVDNKTKSMKTLLNKTKSEFPPGNNTLSGDAHQTSTTTTKDSQGVTKETSGQGTEDKKSEKINLTKHYVFEASKKTIEVLKGVAEIAGVPLVKQVLEIGLSLIEACEELNEIQEKVRQLKNRVAEFLLVIAKFMDRPSDGKLPPQFGDFFAVMSEDLERELGDLKDCLDSITKRLERIKARNVLLTAMLPDSNVDEIQVCEIEFQDAIERFQTLRGLHAAEDVAKLQDKLEIVYNEIKAISQQVTQLQTSFDELKARLEPLDESSLLVPTMPNPPAIFYGRDEIVNEIANTLARPSADGKMSRFCILGPGGLGKTSAALAVMQHSLIRETFGGGQFWIPCNTANSPSALLDALAEGTGVNPQSKNLLRSIVTRLSSCGQCILLLDNFETPWLLDESSQSRVLAILEQLDALPKLAILLTMRSNSPPLRHWKHSEFPPVNLENSRKIYLDIDEAAGDSVDLDILLDTLGYMPGAVYLMANLGANSLSTPTELLQQWRAGGISVMDHCIGLSMNSSFVKGCEGAIELLQVLSMLPAGVVRSHLELWLSSYRPEAIQCLRKAALLLVSSGSDPKLFVLPVIQSCVRKTIPDVVCQRVNGSCCQILLSHSGAIDGPNNPHFKAHSRFIRTEQSNIESLLTEMLTDILKSRTLITMEMMTNESDAFRVFIWYRYWSQPHVELAIQVAQAAEMANNATSQADTLLCLGKMYRITGRSDDSLKTLTRARELFSILDRSQRQNRRNAMRCEVTYTEMSALVRGLRQEDVIPLVEALGPQCEGEDTYLEALRLESLSAFQFKAHLFEAALISISESRNLFRENNCPFDAATCLLDLARILGCLERYEEALQISDEAVSSFHDLGFEGYNTCFSYILKARIMKSLKLPGDVIIKVLNDALKHSHQEPLPLAFTLLEYGEVYLEMKDWRAATLAYEEARKAILRLDREGHRGIPDECDNKLQVIQRYETQGVDPPEEELASLIPAPRLFP